MPSTRVLVLQGIRGRCLRVVGGLFLHLLFSMVDSPVVRELVGSSLRLEDFKLQ